MNRSLIPVCVAVTLLIHAGCAPAPGPSPEPVDTTESDLAAINSLRDEWIAAVNADDLEAQLAAYADDFVLMPFDGNAIVGKAAVREAAEQAAQGEASERLAEFSLSIDELVVAGDWAFERGTSRIVLSGGEGETIEDSGKGITIYRRQSDGSWKMARLIFNRNNPPPASEN